MNSNERRQLRELVSSMCDRTLSDEEVEQLNSLLVSEDAAVEEAVRLLELNADLSQPSLKVNDALSLASDTDDALESCELPQPAARGPATTKKARNLNWFFLGLAASLLAVCSSLITWQVSRAPDAQPEVAVVEDPAETSGAEVADDGIQYAAKIIRKVDCDWQDDRWGVLNSAHLLPEQTLSMNQGLMEIEFASGARVTLQGPASMTVVSPMSAVLFHGRLTATVPEPAKGFKVHTPAGQAIDLGTRFGLMVTEEGLTQAHVFEGEVVIHDSSKRDANPEGIHLTENMAYQFGSSDGSDNIEAEPSSFVDIAFSSGESSVEQPAVTDNLALWLTAERNIQTDSSNRIAGWKEANLGGRSEPITAWQVRPGNRPKVVADAFNGKPGVHFNGKSYLVTDPLSLQPNCTSCIVFKFNAKAVRRHKTTWPQGYQLLNCNGPSTMVMRMNKDLHLSAFMYAGVTRRDDGTESHVKSGVTWSSMLEEKTPHVAAYVNNADEGSARLYIDGALVSERDCDVGKTTEAPRFIGSHNHMNKPRFVGHMAEFLIYNAALTDDQTLALSESLMKKYDIATQ